MNEIERINQYIKSGIVNTRIDANKAASCLVWGAREAQYKDVTWSEVRHGFLGGGVYRHYYYEIRRGVNALRISNYVTSVRMFLRYIDKHEGVIQ